MTTLYATDLDGTLLDASARISAYTARTFNELTSKGVRIAFVTARTPATVEPIAADIRPRVPAVVMTGAAIWDFASRSYLQVHYHRPADVLTIAEICRQRKVVPFVYTLPRGTNSLVVYHAATKLSPIEHSFVTERTINDLKTFHLHSEMPTEAPDCTVLFFAMGEPESIRSVAETISQATDCYASWYPDTYNPGLALLEVFAPGVSKAAGLAELSEMVGANRTIAFGDNLNDIPMLQSADMSVSVENANPEVKAIADRVIGPNTADSVIKFIREDAKG